MSSQRKYRTPRHDDRRHTKHPHCMHFCSKLSHSVSAKDLWKKCTHVSKFHLFVLWKESVCLNTLMLMYKINLSHLVSIMIPFFKWSLGKGVYVVKNTFASGMASKKLDKNSWKVQGQIVFYIYIYIYPCFTLICKKSLSCLDQVKPGWTRNSFSLVTGLCAIKRARMQVHATAVPLA